MAFDPDEYLSNLAVERAKGQPAAEGVPPMLARPNAAGLPDYAHDPVPPHQANDVRAAIGNVVGAEGFDNQHPDAQRKAIIDAVHGVTRAHEPPSFMESLVHSAGSAVPFGHQTGAALASMPVIGNGRSYRDNYDALQADTAAGAAAHPVADVLGRTAGGLTTMAASGGLGAAGAASSAAPSLSRAIAPMAVNTAVGGAQGAADAMTEGGNTGDIVRRAGAGASVGAAATAAIPLAGKAIAGVAEMFKGAMAHSDERILSYVSEGATAKMRNKITEKADETVDAIRSNPRFSDTYKDPAALHHALGEEVASVGNQTQHFYGEAETAGGKLDPQAVTKAMKTAKGLMGFDQEEIGNALDTHIGKFEKRTPQKMSQESQIEYAREALKSGKPVPVIKSEIAGNGLSLDEARREVTRLQAIAFDRLDTTITTPAREAAAKAAGILKDALERHVDQYAPGAGAQVRALNDKQTVLLRLEAAAAYKAKNAPTAGGTRLSKVADYKMDAASLLAGAAAGAGAGMTGHGRAMVALTGAAVAAAPRLSIAAKNAATEGMAAVGRKVGTAGIDSAADALSPGPATNLLARKLAGLTNHGAATHALVTHVFGAPVPGDGKAAPYTFGGDAGADSGDYKFGGD